ncbi:MAG TPA: alpha/beta hydrolase-fold protein [Candidatus Dormibacteraeota bacterium]|nr:alpha/beta hydrolase-fold protein [Candidatus Dormibacteraeota bacterium]
MVKTLKASNSRASNPIPHWSICALSLFPWTGASAQLAADPQEAKSFISNGSHTNKIDYLLHLPRGYQAHPDTKWPLMLFLHGAGERGGDVQAVAWNGPPKLVKEGHDLPFVIVSPQCASNQWWNDAILLGLLDDVEARYRIDTNRVYLTGLSMGGYGTWSLGFKHPERFAALVPICGGGQPSVLEKAGPKKLEAIKSLGIWVFHGVKDQTVPIAKSERMVEGLKKIGCTDVTFTKYPNADHDSWTFTYNNPQLYHWLLAHHRN